jgi:hypothetical protein
MAVIALGSSTLGRLEQFSNAVLPMLVTDWGMLMLVKALQPEKVLSPMVVTVLGSSTLFRPEQYMKALLLRVVTPCGMVTLDRLRQLVNAA